MSYYQGKIVSDEYNQAPVPDWISKWNPYLSSTNPTNSFSSYKMAPVTVKQESFVMAMPLIDSIKKEPEDDCLRNGFHSNSFYKFPPNQAPPVAYINLNEWPNPEPGNCYQLTNPQPVKQECDPNEILSQHQTSSYDQQSTGFNHTDSLVNYSYRSFFYNPDDSVSSDSVELLFERAGLQGFIQSSPDELLEIKVFDDLLEDIPEELPQVQNITVEKVPGKSENNPKAFNRKHYKCPQCSFSTSGKDYLTEHIEKIHSEFGYNNKCNTRRQNPKAESSSGKKNDSSHEKHPSVKTEKPFKCSQCSYNTHQSDRLRKHIDSKHSNGACKKSKEKSRNSETQSIKVRKNSICLQEKQKSTKQSNTKHHKCPQCSYSAHRNDRLMKHIAKIHSKNVCYKCNQCQFESTYNREYYEHMKTHFDGPPFQCEACSYKSKLITAFMAHRVTHTGDRLFNCTLCKFSCKRKYHLKGHMISHSKEKNFLCTQCSKRYSYKCSLVRHLKTSCKGKSA